jgi:hypothetical protein
MYSKTYLIPFGFCISCSENAFNWLKDPNPGGDEIVFEPQIVVTPESLDFGLQYYQQPAVERTLQIVNIGSGTLEVDQLTITGEGSRSFSIIQPTTTLSLEPQESWQTTVLFTALERLQQAEIIVNSNDAEHPSITVPLYGAGSIPDLLVTPNPLDWNDIAIGCEPDGQLLLLNQGTEDLLVSSVTMPSSPEFSILSSPSFPFTLGPSQSQSIDLVFAPSNVETYTNQLEITSNDPDNAVEIVELLGQGTADFYEESWTIAQAPSSDIIFSVDLSGSMTDEQQALGQQFHTFISQLSTYTNDWQVMVVNADHGCNHSGILTQNTADYETTFLQAVQTGAYDISFTEALLTAVANGVEKTDTTECNEGFLRSNAMLHIIMLSDECEQSPNPGICGTQWQDYVDRIIAQKGDPNLVRMSAIAGDYPSGCSMTGQPNSQTAEFGSGYYEASVATGGLFISICSDWTDPLYLQQLASASILQATFELEEVPIVNSITVSIDGNSLTSGWNYDASSNSILLDTQPAELSTVSVEYYAIFECE